MHLPTSLKRFLLHLVWDAYWTQSNGAASAHMPKYYYHKNKCAHTSPSSISASPSLKKSFYDVFSTFSLFNFVHLI